MIPLISNAFIQTVLQGGFALSGHGDNGMALGLILGAWGSVLVAALAGVK